MKHYFKNIFKSSLAVLLCLGAMTAAAQLKITQLYTFASTADGGTVLTSETGEAIYIDVEFDDNIFDFSTNTTLRPTLSFTVGAMNKSAEFLAVNGNFMSFRYYPQPSDYGTGLKIKDVAYPSARILINIPTGLTIRNPASTQFLQPINQYAQSVATLANATAYNQSIGLNMYKLENADGAGISVARGSTRTITVSRPFIAANNATSIKLLALSTNSAVATVSPSSYVLPGTNSSCNFVINGVASGNSLVRIYSQDHPSEFVEIPVTVVNPPVLTALAIDDIQVFADTGSATNELISETSQALYIDVFFGDILHDFTADPGDTGARPEFEFLIGNQARLASFESISGNLMTFTYAPQPNDYGMGFTIKTPASASARNIIRLNGARITSFDGTKELTQANQYDLPFANSINTDADNQTVAINLFKIENSNAAGISIIRGDYTIITVNRPSIAAANLTDIKLLGVSTSNAVATVGPSPGTMFGGSASHNFRIDGITPGTATIRISSQDYPTQFIEIPVTVMPSAAERSITLTSIATGESWLDVDENGGSPTHKVRVRLGKVPTSDVTLAVNRGGLNSGWLVFAPTVTIVANSDTAIFSIGAPDGPVSAVLTFSDPLGNFDPKTFSVEVNNIAPAIYSPYSSTNMTTAVAATAVIGETVTLTAGAFDPALEYDDPITYMWVIMPQSRPWITNFNQTVSFVMDVPTTVTLDATDKDGGRATRLTINYTVESGVLLTLRVGDEPTLQGVGTGRFLYLDPSNRVWTAANPSIRFNAGFSTNGVLVRAIPDIDSYLFTWLAESGILTPLSAFNMPTRVSDVTIKLKEATVVEHLFSRAFYAGIDSFGDIDADGLSDIWEAGWFGSDTSENLGSTPNTDPRGVNGAEGNVDGDYLPLAGLQSIPNVQTNGLVMVYQYPITDHGGAAWDWTGYLPNVNNPFSNIIEYRGLLEDRDLGDGWVRYAMAMPTVGSPLRGNDSATDPNILDTDEDQMTDGWEYYFWTTIMYEVNATNNWRAFDPSFNFYNATNSAAAGLPLLSLGLPDPVITDALPNAYANGGLADAFEGTITNTLPIRPGTFTVTFNDATVYIDDGRGRLFATNVVDTLIDPVTISPVPTEVQVLSIDYTTGEWIIVPPPGATAGADFVITYEILDGLYTKQQLLDAFDPAKRGDPMADTDQDGLYDWEEFVLGTNPIHWDTDGDSMPDGWEVERGLDPLNGDRILGNANGALGNLDGDKMAGTASVLEKHSSVYANDLQNMTYWNGERPFGFNPSLGWMEGNDGQPDFTNLEEFRVAEYYVLDLEAVDAVDKDNWLEYTTDPCDNDTNGDGIPDGWALYVGVSAILPLPPRVVDRELTPIVGDGDDYDDDGLLVLAEFQCTGAAAFREADETVTANGVTAIRRAFGNLNPLWTNKTRPTDPWNADTDGDGLIDGREYRDPTTPPLDYNADGNSLVNLNPTSVDTDRDWLPDAWEYYMGLQTTNNPSGDYYSPTGTYGDPDGDGLSNFQEYLTGVNYGWRFDKRYSPQDESLWLPRGADPYAIAFRPYDAGDFLRPFPNPASLNSGLEAVESAEGTLGISPPAPADPVYGYTYLELLQRTMVVMQDGGFFGLPETIIQSVMAFEANIRNANFSYGLQPLTWDPAVLAIGSPVNMDYFFIAEQVSSLFATANPRSIDSDFDGMDDYWEVFHGMNPIYGGDRVAVESQNDLMLGIVELNSCQSLSLNGFGPLSRAGKEDYRLFQVLAKWRPFDLDEPRADILQPQYYNMYWNTAIPYDLVNNPALSGCPFGDIDKDGLSSQEESFNLYAADIFSHTDPSPYWLTDVSYDSSYFYGINGAGSHVNNYYASGSMRFNWWWNYAYDAALDAAPTYLFDFEVNEGYDTDNDNISDREELTSTDSLGATDPLDFDSPRSRKAMYLNGNAACRTRNPFFHDKWALTSYSVELWFRAEEPVGSGYQTLIERPVVVPVDSPSTAWAIRRTFRLSLTPDGRFRAEMDNDALNTFSAETAVANGRISPNVWYHVAVTMDSQKNRFIIYLNGSMMASLACDIKPSTGYFVGSQVADYDPPAGSNTDLVLLDTYRFSAAPIVVGASDSHPSYVIAGSANPEFTDFFKGWVDEIRVWDRVRSQGEIQNDMYKRYGKEEVARINDARFAWDQNNGFAATALSDFPQKILYHFSFDNLPDVIPSPSRDPNADIPGSETDELPAGYAVIGSLARPAVTDYPGVPWWFASPVRSTVYNADYTYVPFIENTAAHLRQYPPFDIKGVLPIFDANFNVLGYRWRNSADWIAIYDRRFEAYNPVNTNASFDIAPRLIPNTANPYGFKYMTGLSLGYELNPTGFDGEVGMFSQYEDVPIYTDMLPLLDAVADIDVAMWDGLGAGWNYAALDTDGDGLPDWWETANGLDPYDSEGDNGAYGDPDADGLDNWGEYLAGTNPFAYDTNGDGYSDSDSRPDGQSLTYGEMYDDQDGMPSAWEVQYGLNPNRYDADHDMDNDGWTNYEEYMAGTNPADRTSFPRPDWNVKFIYDGVLDDFYNSALVAYSYSEYSYGERMGTDPSEYTWGGKMGGDPDGIWMAADQLGDEDITFDTDGRAQLAHSVITPRSVFVSGPLVDHATYVNHIIRGYCDDPIDAYTGQILCILGGLPVTIAYNEGVLSGGPPGGTVHITYRWSFAGDLHIRSGWNRFFGFIDQNGDTLYDEGEPCGLSVARPTLVSWDPPETAKSSTNENFVYYHPEYTYPANTIIALTDFLVGYPRIGWEQTQSEIPYNCCDYYTVTFSANGNPIATFNVDKPRTFFHEGDMLAAGVNGLDFGAATKVTFDYTVSHCEEVLKSGIFCYDLGTVATRRKMKARYPVQLQKVFGTVVNFEWEMDYRTEGARISIIGMDDGKTYYDELVPLPTRHGKITDEIYFYHAAPQLMDGKKFFELPPGRYEYIIKEYIRTTSGELTKQAITERFQLVDESEESRELYSISGNVSYFGKAEMSAFTQELHTFDGIESGYVGMVPGPSVLNPGTISFQVIDGSGNIIESLNDSNGDGALLSESGSALGGGIDYDTRNYNVEFSPGSIPSGYKLVISFKSFLKPIVVEAYSLPAIATTCFAFPGQPVARTVQFAKGAYTINGLAAGKYAVRAYLDSDNDRFLDSWESWGIAVNGPVQGPVVYTTYPAISVPTSQKGKDIVIRDRDTDNDLLADAWEYQNFGSLAAQSGYDQAEPDLYVWQEYADGALDSDPNRVDTDDDGLSDAVELRLTGTDTHEVDSDKDGISDLEEFLSGSNPVDPTSAVPYKTLGVEFDAGGKPFVLCPYPALVRGIKISYILKHKENLSDTQWTAVYEPESVSAPNVTLGTLKAGVMMMKPDADLIEDWSKGFFRVDVQVDSGEWTIY